MMVRTFVAAAAMASTLLSLSAHAQSVDKPAGDEVVSSGLAEVVVSAQRRAESQQDVPIAISAFSAEQLQSKGVSNTLELAQYVPNMIANNNTGLSSANSFYIRGIGNTETIPTFDPPVGVYVDDVYISRQNANNFAMLNVDRVEVMRGPQGTLFGRNTTGGAISLVMAQPELDTFEGQAEVGFGSYDKKLARGSVNLPMGSRFAASLSGYWQDDDGYVKNVTTGQRLNDDDGWGVRAALYGEFGDRTRWTASYAHIQADGENIVNFTCNPANPTQCGDRYVTTGMIEGSRAPVSPFAPLAISGRKANYMLGTYTGSDLVTSKVEFDVNPDTTLAFISGYVRTTQEYALDFYDGRGGPTLANPTPPITRYTTGGFVIANDSRAEQFSQEIKLNGTLFDGYVDYVTGVYYMDEKNKVDFADIFTASSTTRLLLADRILRNSTEAYAGYAQADFNVTAALKLTAGIRYTDETKGIALHDNRAVCNSGPLLPTCLDTSNLTSANGTEIPTELRTKIWTPRFAANYKATDDLLLFASATRGFKSGGWNARGTSPVNVLPFDPEKVWSYELGVKSELFDRRLRANATVYFTDVADLQTPSSLVSPSGTTTFITRNFADFESRGVELELLYAPFNGLNLYLNAGYQDAEYKIDRNAPEFDIYGTRSVAAQQAQCQALVAAGNIPGGVGTTSFCAVGIVAPDGSIAKPVRTPDFTLALGGDYEIALGDYALVPSLNASWHSDQEAQTSNYTIYSGEITGTNGTFPANPYGGGFITGSDSEAVWLVNAGLALNGPDNRWQVAANCSNCTDEAWVQGVLGYTYLSAPRTWTVRARFSF